MGIRINQNVMAMNAYRNLTQSEGALSKSLEKLSSGFRINRAADDASGLVISEGLRSQVAGLRMAVRNAQDGVSVVQTAEGALTEVSSLLQRMRELAVQASSTGASDTAARSANQSEVVELLAEVNRIAGTTKFGGQTLLDGTYGVTQARAQGGNTALSGVFAVLAAADSFTINIGGGARAVQLTAGAAGTYTRATLETMVNNAIKGSLALAGDNPDSVTATVTQAAAGAAFQIRLQGANNVNITLADTEAGTLANLGLAAGAFNTVGTGGAFQVGAGVGETITVAISGTDTTTLGLGGLDVAANPSGALTAVDAAVTQISTLRGQLGAKQNRLEHTIANLQVTTENLMASESRIRDTDMASEMMAFTRAQILQQAGTAMLAQANAVPQTVLQLLQQR